MKLNSSLKMINLYLLLFVLSPLLVRAQTCNQGMISASQQPNVAEGYQAQLVINGIENPRHMVFDSAGNLLVAGSPMGIFAYTFEGMNTDCVTFKDRRLIIEDMNMTLNHGIALSADGETLYASSSSTAYAWSYNANDFSATNRRAVVTGMHAHGHSLRSLLSPALYPEVLIVSRGPTFDMDYDALHPANGKSMVKAFNLSAMRGEPYDFARDGMVLGWGLRNPLGIAEDKFGGLWAMDNSVDTLLRQNIDVSENNPAEELNWLGYLNETVGVAGYYGPNFGYPTCFAAWDHEMVPNSRLVDPGSQFAAVTNNTFTDDDCRNNYTAPALTFTAHSTPYDLKFHPLTGNAWMAFHGSWTRANTSGYSLAVVPMSPEGRPVADSGVTWAAIEILTNPNMTVCPKECFRPSGVAFDAKGRVWMSSDDTGEIWIVNTPGVVEVGGAGYAQPVEPEDGAAELKNPGLVTLVMGLMLGVVLGLGF